jgi:uncharacterized protein YyaL (SSP411 family)
MLAALELYIGGMKEVVITASTKAAARQMIQEFDRHFVPDCVLLVATGRSYDRLKEVSSLLEGRTPDKSATVYICENFACKRPLTSVPDLTKALVEPKTQPI